ncbi:MAG: hypothetical protein K0Q90_2033, partial [Paenibacillaceae bacterium]|nr:hypothetical protein [Paenibacillaceae bacterium]
MLRTSRLGLSTVWLLILCLVLAPVNAAFGAGSSPDYKGHWAEKQISRWVEQGFIDGYDDGTFRPDQSVTRGEFVKLVNHSFNLKEAAAIHFTDLTSAHWAYEEVRIAVKAGYISGYEDNTIRLDRKITRQEAAAIVSRLLHLTASPEGAKGFSDSGKLASWSIGAVGAAAAKGIIDGYEDGTFKPEAPIMRSETVTILDKAMGVKGGAAYSSAGTYGPEEGTVVIAGNAAISVKDVTLRNTIIEGDLLLAEGIGEGDVKLKNVTVKGVTTIQGGGAHSVHLIDSVFSKIVVDKKTGSIRIVLEGTTNAQELTVETETLLETSAGSVIKEAVLHAVTTVKGQGSIERATLEAAAKGTTFEKQPSKTAGAGLPASGTTGGSDVTGGGSNGGGTTPETPTVSVSVYGTVMNANQGPVNQAKVTVTGTTYSAQTNSNGQYTLSAIADGTYTLTITKSGFEALTTSSFEVKKDVRIEVNAQLVSLPVSQYTISGEEHIILDEMDRERPTFYPYQVLAADGQALEEGQVEWSLEFPFEVTLPEWEMTYMDPASPGYGLAIQPDTGVLHTGWYSWIGDFGVVAKSKADGSVLASKTVRHSYNNVDRVVSTNGTITLYFLEEPEWRYYTQNGEKVRYYQNIDLVEADIRNSQSGGKYVNFPFTNKQYDEATNSVTFQFAPFGVKATEQ